MPRKKAGRGRHQNSARKARGSSKRARVVRDGRASDVNADQLDGQSIDRLIEPSEHDDDAETNDRGLSDCSEDRNQCSPEVKDIDNEGFGYNVYEPWTEYFMRHCKLSKSSDSRLASELRPNAAELQQRLAQSLRPSEDVEGHGQSSPAEEPKELDKNAKEEQNGESRTLYLQPPQPGAHYKKYSLQTGKEENKKPSRMEYEHHRMRDGSTEPNGSEYSQRGSNSANAPSRKTEYLNGHQTGYQTVHQTGPHQNETQLKKIRTVEEAINDLHRSHCQMFSQWMFELSCGFNIGCYGYGSKRELLLDFAKKLTSYPIYVLNGYSPYFDMRAVLEQIGSQICGRELPKGCLSDMATALVQIIKDSFGESPSISCLTPLQSLRPKDDVLLVFIVHNIDGPIISQEQSLNALSILADAPRVRIIASMDHMNAPLMFSPALSERFNFVWHDATTFAPYEAENAFTKLGNGTMQRSTRSIEGIEYVLSSLTSNARCIYQLILAKQIETEQAKQTAAAEERKKSKSVDTEDMDLAENGDDGDAGPVVVGVSTGDLLDECISNFLVSNDQSLQIQLKEFRDHEMIEITPHGNKEIITVPLSLDQSRQLSNKLGDS